MQWFDVIDIIILLFHITLCNAIHSMLLNSVRYIDEIKHQEYGAIWELTYMVRFNMASIISSQYVEYKYYQ